jgi:hypothetical protein
MKSNKRKKVISRRNAGLGDNLFATAHAWYYAKKTGRDLNINWAPSMYLDDKSANAFPFFFKVPENIDGVPIIIEPRINAIKKFIRRLPLFPFRYFIPALIAESVHKLLRKQTPGFLMRIMDKRRQWSINLITNGIDVSYRTIIFNSHYGFLINETKPFFMALKLKDEFQQLVDTFTQQNFIGKKVVGLHIKYYDKSMPKSNHTKYWLDPQQSLNLIKENLESILSSLNIADEYVIYLATDSSIVEDFLKAHFNNIVSFNKEFKIEYTQGQHLKLTDDAVTAALVEMFLLAKSDVLYRFPPSGSWFSHYGSLFAQKTIM